MADERARRLAELHREREAQDAAWARAKERLAALGDVQVGVPEDVLDEIARACAGRRPTPEVADGYAVRG